MVTKHELEQQITKLRRARNTLFVCAVLAAGTGSAVTVQLLKAQEYGHSQFNAKIKAADNFAVEHSYNLVLSSKLELAMNYCLQYEKSYRSANVANGGADLPVFLQSKPSYYGGPTKCEASE